MLLTILCPLLLALPQTGPQTGPQDPPGIDEITSARIGADLRFLADEVLAGRGTPSSGLEIAAGFIEARLARLGLTPGTEGGFRQAVPLAHRRIEPAGTLLTVTAADTSRELVFGQDYYPGRLSHLIAWEAAGPLVSVGTGQNPEVQPLDLKGRWAVVFERGGEKIRPTLQRLAEAGAAGALVTPGPTYGAGPYEGRYGETAQAMLNGVTTRSGSTPSGPDLPMVMLPRGTWEGLVRLSPVEWSEDVPPAGTELELHVDDRRALVDPSQPASNLVARLQGTGAEVAREVILLVAHYDGPGAPGGVVHPAADRNASGSAALLAVAEGLTRHGPLERTVLLLWTAGNGQGNLGGRHFAQAPGLKEGERVVLVLELQSLGNGPANGIQMGPGPTSSWYSPAVERLTESAALESFTQLSWADPSWPRSEARLLARTFECQAVLLTAGPTDRHRTPKDAPPGVNIEKVTRAARATLRYVLQAARID